MMRCIAAAVVRRVAQAHLDGDTLKESKWEGRVLVQVKTSRCILRSEGGEYCVGVLPDLRLALLSIEGHGLDR